MQKASGKIKRNWCYAQQPLIYCMSGCSKCKGTNITWSEYKKHCWCFDCKIDYIPEHTGLFDGFIPLYTANMLGIHFDIINLKTNKKVKYDSKLWKKLIKT